MKIRLWLVEHRLTAAEEQRVREYRKNRTEHEGQVKITYRKKRVVKDVEAVSPSLAAAAETLTGNQTVGDLPDVLAKFTTVFAAAPAEDGEKCSQIENAWSAEEQLLPLEDQ